MYFKEGKMTLVAQFCLFDSGSILPVLATTCMSAGWKEWFGVIEGEEKKKITAGIVATTNIVAS